MLSPFAAAPAPARRPPVGLGTPYHLAGRSDNFQGQWGLPSAGPAGGRLNAQGVQMLANAQSQYMANMVMPALFGAAMGQIGIADPFGQQIRAAKGGPPAPPAASGLPPMSLADFWSLNQG